MKHSIFFKIFFTFLLTLTFVCCGENDNILENTYKSAKIPSDLLKVAAFGENLSVDEIFSNVNNSNPSRSSACSLSFSDSIKIVIPKKESRNSSIVDSVNIYCVYDEDLNISTLVCGNRLYPFTLAVIDGEFKTDDLDLYGISDYISLLPAYLANNKTDYSAEEITEVESQIVSADYSDGVYSFVIEDENGMLPLQRLEYETVYGNHSVVNPLLTVKWGQSYPYNTTLDPVINSYGTGYVLPPTGCVAVAICQILSYHKTPSSISVDNMSWLGDWDAMTQSPSASSLTATYQTQIANLMKIVGKGVDMSYAWNGSGASINEAYDFITSTLNFDTDAISNYSHSAIYKSLSNDCPVYVRGTDTTTESGHAWVLDGCKTETEIEYERIYRTTVDNPSYPIDPREWLLISTRVLSEASTPSVHCNWGWNGSSDGYFISGVFDVASYSFNTNIKTICNIEPK